MPAPTPSPDTVRSVKKNCVREESNVEYPLMSAFISAWFDAQIDDWRRKLAKTFTEMPNNTRCQVRTIAGVRVTELNWSKLTMMRSGDVLDFEFEYNGHAFRTEAEAGTIWIIMPTALPHTTADALQVRTQRLIEVTGAGAPKFQQCAIYEFSGRSFVKLRERT